MSHPPWSYDLAGSASPKLGANPNWWEAAGAARSPAEHHPPGSTGLKVHPGEGASHVPNPRVGNTNRQRRAQPSHPPRRGRAEERVRGVTPTIRIQAAEHVLRRRGEAGTVVAAWANPAPNVGFTALRSEELRGATDPLRGCGEVPPRVQATPHQRPKRLIRPTERSQHAGLDRPHRSVRYPVERVTAAEQLT